MNISKFKLQLVIFSGMLISIRAESQQLFKQMGAELSVWNRNIPFSEGMEPTSSKTPVFLFTLEGISQLSEQLNVITRVGYGAKQQNFQFDGTTASRIEVTHQLIPVHLGIEYSLPLSASMEKHQQKQGTVLTVEAGLDRYFELNHILQFDAAGTTLDDSRTGGNFYGYSGGLALERRFHQHSLAITARYRGILLEDTEQTETAIVNRNPPSGLDIGLRLRVHLSKPQRNSVKP